MWLRYRCRSEDHRVVIDRILDKDKRDRAGGRQSRTMLCAALTTARVRARLLRLNYWRRHTWEIFDGGSRSLGLHFPEGTSA